MNDKPTAPEELDVPEFLTQPTHEQRPVRRNAADVLQEMADTYRERNAVYGDNFKNVGPVIKAMFPDGIRFKTADDLTKWHLFELLVVKLTRFANSGLLHVDSILDAGVYAAMIKQCIDEQVAKAINAMPTYKEIDK